jgi:surface polysaccharide O-acyltransferase-like enzyme
MNDSVTPLSINSDLSSNSRLAWADLCRVIAIFGVIVIHACGQYFYRYGQISNADWLGTNLLDSFVRCSVPLFVMLSGALLLNSSDTKTTALKALSRVMKVLLPLLAWSAFYLLYKRYYSSTPINWLEGFSQPVIYHLWFVYMIVGLYLLLPILEAVYRLLLPSKSLQIYIGVLWVIVTVLPTFQMIPVLSIMQQSSLFGYGGYFVLGGLLWSQYAEHSGTKRWLVVYLTAVLATFFITWHLTTKGNAVNETAFVYFSPGVVLASIAAFILLTQAKVNGRFKKALSKASDVCFLVFFMHTVFLERVQGFTTKHVFSEAIYAPIAIVFNASLTFILCLALSILIRKMVPFTQKFIG